MSFDKTGEFDVFDYRLSVYRHTRCGAHVLHLPLPGPLVSAQIVFATGAFDDSGLAHTLEHLIFCGSRSYPQRGFLDTLAVRSLSSGTNAYTADDHTAYSITTAGPEGFARVLPVFVDHILHPTLSDHQFITEVYHVDGVAAEQGVVFCEMAGREHSEADLIDLHVRKGLFPESAYAFESGGKTEAIRQLTNSDVKNYHNHFYSPENMGILICGTIDIALIFQALSSVNFSPVNHISSLPTTVSFSNSQTPSQTASVEKIEFPSQDESVGTMVFSWQGPASNDFETIVSLDILLRYLQDTTASPLYQTFVENDEPWCAEVDFDIKTYFQTALVIYFSGVNCNDNDSVMFETSDQENDSGDDDMDDISTDESESSDEAAVVYVEPLTFKERLLSLLKSLVAPGIIARSDLDRTIDRYLRKIREALEDDPHEVAANYIIPDITRFHIELLNKNAEAEDLTLRCTRGSVFEIVSGLSKLPMDHWTSLIQTWFIDNPVSQLVARPSKRLAATLADADSSQLAARKLRFGKDGLSHLSKIASDAFDANKVNLSQETLDAFPPVPNISNLPKVPCEVSFCDTAQAKNGVRRPFAQCQVLFTGTRFTHCRIGFNIAFLPNKLRQYLVLLQELIFQSPVASMGKKELDYRLSIRRSSELFVSYEAAVGFGNETWSCGWLPDIFTLAFSCEPKQFSEGISWMIEVLFNARFTKDRIASAVQKLLSDLYEVRRDGGCLLSAVSTRLTSVRKQSLQKHPSGVDNELHIGIFSQGPFLKDLSKKLQNGGRKSGVKAIIDALDSLRCMILQGCVGYPGFAQLSLPTSESGQSPVGLLLGRWDKEMAKFQSSRKLKAVFSEKSEKIVTFPYPRKAFSISDFDFSQFGQNVIVPVEGITASYMSLVVACDVLKSDDYFGVVLLAELLSRTEGPLYTSVRGKGFAYDASVTLSPWTGQLNYDVSESSDPYQAVTEFFGILNSFGTDEGFSKICSSFNLETARAAVAFRLVAEKSTGAACIGAWLRKGLRGILTDNEESEIEKSLFKVTDEDLRKVYNTHFRKFFGGDSRFAVLITKPQTDAETDDLVRKFQEQPLGIELTVVKKLKEFEI
ncbi:hypothetical protein HDU84_003129 [Entophlyctis sp. JEL0112]|nr:hypothetical protein HDU84_003129 [Entophlyctis sp. JEL0112]